jgi:hypothetical protein
MRLVALSRVSHILETSSVHDHVEQAAYNSELSFPVRSFAVHLCSPQAYLHASRAQKHTIPTSSLKPH